MSIYSPISKMFWFTIFASASSPIFSMLMPKEIQHQKLSVTNDTQYALKLKSEKSLMSQLVLPKEQQTFTIARYKKVLIALANDNINEGLSFEVPAGRHYHVTITEEYGELAFNGCRRFLIGT